MAMIATAKKTALRDESQLGLFDMFIRNPIEQIIIPADEMPMEDEQVQQVVDPRNSLNDLTGKEWLPRLE